MLERIRGVMVGRFLVCSESMLHGVSASFLFSLFCLGSGWMFFSYHHLKIITSELFKINVGWFLSAPTTSK